MKLAIIASCPSYPVKEAKAIKVRWPTSTSTTSRSSHLNAQLIGPVPEERLDVPVHFRAPPMQSERPTSGFGREDRDPCSPCAGSKATAASVISTRSPVMTRVAV